MAVGAHVGALYWGPTQFILRVEPLALETWARIVAVAFSVIVVVEVHKLLRGPGRLIVPPRAGGREQSGVMEDVTLGGLGVQEIYNRIAAFYDGVTEAPESDGRRSAPWRCSTGGPASACSTSALARA